MVKKDRTMLTLNGVIAMTGTVLRYTTGANKTLDIETSSMITLVGMVTLVTSLVTLSFVTKKTPNGSC
jgi:hypothetical protein